MIPQQAIDLVKRLEGCKLTAYKCPADVWTIGYGHTGSDVAPNATITMSIAEDWLKEDLGRAQRAVRKLVTTPLSEAEEAALISFVFNVGVGAFEQSALLKKLNKGRYEEVPDEMARWNKITKTLGGKTIRVVSDGLVNRRAAEIALWNDGAQTAMPQAVAVPKDPSKVPAQTALAAGTLASVVGIVDQIQPALPLLQQMMQYAPWVVVGVLVCGVALVVYEKVRD